MLSLLKYFDWGQSFCGHPPLPALPISHYGTPPLGVAKVRKKIKKIFFRTFVLPPSGGVLEAGMAFLSTVCKLKNS